ncbi:hypothetical protein PVAP13_5NG196081 [Panicum virgatum]|uniref:Uncharacterized protein n=1 Tax=Panicum virgatum TaxID=38727 RepID=A0A8T0RPF5_PANVG|nr:hypothetical protein PVAP13_5NG196081 [Panicum virgatum]
MGFLDLKSEESRGSARQAIKQAARQSRSNPLSPAPHIHPLPLSRTTSLFCSSSPTGRRLPPLPVPVTNLFFPPSHTPRSSFPPVPTPRPPPLRLPQAGRFCSHPAALPAATPSHQIRRPPTSDRPRPPWSRCRSSRPPARRCEEHESTLGGRRLHLPRQRRATVAPPACYDSLPHPPRSGELRRAELELRSSRTRACLTGSPRVRPGSARAGVELEPRS